MDQVKFMGDRLLKILSDMVCLSRSYQFKFFKYCLPQILLGPLLHTLTHMINLYLKSLFEKHVCFKMLSLNLKYDLNITICIFQTKKNCCCFLRL